MTGPTVIALNTLDSLGGNAALMNFDDTLSFNWPIVSADSITGFDTSNFTFDTSSFANVFSGTFSVALLMLQGQQAVVLNYTPSTVALGDVNLDGLVNLLDIQPFVALLTNGQFQSEADINQDGLVNLLDIEGFVDLLSGG